jgi:hypothetical protein
MTFLIKSLVLTSLLIMTVLITLNTGDITYNAITLKINKLHAILQIPIISTVICKVMCNLSQL